MMPIGLEIRRRMLLLAFLPLLPAPARAACSVTAGDFDGNGSTDVRIAGDARTQGIVIRDAQLSYQVQVDCNGDGDYTDVGDIDTGVQPFAVETFDVQGNGQDDVTYLTTSIFSGALKNVSVTLGPSIPTRPNSVLFLISQSVLASSFVFDVLGGAGPDRVRLQTQALTGSSIVLRGDLGAGDDSVLFNPIGTLTSSFLTNDLDLGLGSNVLTVAPTGAIDATTILTTAVGSSSATQTDQFAWAGYKVMSNGSRSLMDFSLLAGNDRLGAHVVPGVFQILNNSAVVLRARGGPGNDTFAFEDGAGLAGIPNNGLIEMEVAGGPGSDVMTVDWSGPISGTGTSRFRLSGGDGADILWSALDVNSASSNPNFDVLLEGGRGNDLLYTSVVDPSGLALYQPLGATLSDGGADVHSCIFFGSGLNRALTCESGS